jgi:hypothetical protein
MSNKEMDGSGVRRSRSQRRLTMTTPIRLKTGLNGETIPVENRDISWGGIRFSVPKGRMPETSSITIQFPWTQGDLLSVDAEILRTESLDEEHDLVAARFSSLSSADHRRLERLLEMLHSPTEGMSEQDVPLAPALEVMMSDPDEIQEKLEELGAGRMSVTVLETYEINQSIRLILGGVSTNRTLRLRARVADITPLMTEEDSAWPIYDLDLRFEHPIEELKAAAASMSKALAKTMVSSSGHSDTEL